MRLIELFMPENDPGSKRLAKLQATGSHVGSGGYAMVRKGGSAKREGEVIKIPLEAMLDDFSNDPYVVFVKNILRLQKKGYKNPYLPVIKKFKQVKDKNNMNFYYAILEHLYHESSLNEDQINHIKEQLFYNYQKLGKIKNPSIDILINDAYEKNPGNIKDKKFAEALRIIQGTQKRSTGFGFDIAGRQNHMYRTTGSVPQLVLADPLA